MFPLASGALALFGGGLGDPENYRYGARKRNDLWLFNLETKQWSWLLGGGASLPTPHWPGVRSAFAWDASDTELTIYGGVGEEQQTLNDLWTIDLTKASADNLYSGESDPPQRGTLGEYSDSSHPGSRQGAALFVDGKGHVLLSGGAFAFGTQRYSDILAYDLAQKKWAWVGGSDSENGAAHRGTKGVAEAANHPEGTYEYASTYYARDRDQYCMFGGRIGLVLASPGSEVWCFSPASPTVTEAPTSLAPSVAPGSPTRAPTEGPSAAPTSSPTQETPAQLAGWMIALIVIGAAGAAALLGGIIYVISKCRSKKTKYVTLQEAAASDMTSYADSPSWGDDTVQPETVTIND